MSLHKVSSIKKRLRELDWPAQSRATPVFDLDNAHVAEWEQIPAARFNIGWTASKQVEAIKAAD